MQFADEIAQHRAVMVTNGVADTVKVFGADRASLVAEYVFGRRAVGAIRSAHLRFLIDHAVPPRPVAPLVGARVTTDNERPSQFNSDGRMA